MTNNDKIWTPYDISWEFIYMGFKIVVLKNRLIPKNSQILLLKSWKQPLLEIQIETYTDHPQTLHMKSVCFTTGYIFPSNLLTQTSVPQNGQFKHHLWVKCILPRFWVPQLLRFFCVSLLTSSLCLKVSCFAYQFNTWSM